MTPKEETDIVFAAIGIAHEIATPLLAQPEPVEATREQTLAMGLMFMFDRWWQQVEKPKQYRCGWCVAAAGGDQPAWQAAECLDAEGIRVHTMACGNNPIVQQRDALRAELAEAVRERDALRSRFANFIRADEIAP